MSAPGLDGEEIRPAEAGGARPPPLPAPAPAPRARPSRGARRARLLLRLALLPVRLPLCWLHRGDGRRWLLLAAGLVLDVLSLPPGPLPFLVLVADVPFLLLLLLGDGRRWKRWALLYGALHFGVGLRWLAEIHPVEVLGAAVVLGPVYVLLGLALRWFARRRVPFGLAVGLCVVGEEILRTVWMGGMPWPARSLSFASDAPLDPGLSRLLPAGAWLGAYALSCFAGLCAGTLVEVFVLRRRAARGVRVRAALAPLAALAVLVGLALGRTAGQPAWRDPQAHASARELVVVQADVPQSLKHGDAAGVKRMFDEHLALSATAVRRLGARHVLAVLWPETMVPWPFLDADLAERFPEAWDNEVGVARRLHHDVPEARHLPWLVGAIHQFRRGQERHADLWAYGSHDSLFWLDPSRAPAMDAPTPAPPPPGGHPPWVLARHDKTVLVPGGEYTPGGEIFPPLRWFRNVVSVIPELEPGAEDQVPFAMPLGPGPADGTVRMGTVVCFELAFPARCRRWRRNGAQVLLNPGNYGWFGPTGFRSQIAALARLRAAELAVPVVMAGNTGPSAFYDPFGRPYGTFEPLAGGRPEPAGGPETTYRLGYAHARLRWDGRESTPYTTLGDLPWGLLGLLLVLAALLRGPAAPAPAPAVDDVRAFPPERG